MDNLNDIIFSSTTRSWFEGKKILPESWDIPEESKTKLLELNVGLLTIRSPGSVYDARDKKQNINQAGAPSRTHKDYEALIILDVVRFEEAKLLNREIVGSILHEFGHLIYQASGGFNLEYDMLGPFHEDEVCADKFVMECGYAADFIRALAACGAEKSEPIQDRIKRLSQ